MNRSWIILVKLLIIYDIGFCQSLNELKLDILGQVLQEVKSLDSKIEDIHRDVLMMKDTQNALQAKVSEMESRLDGSTGQSCVSSLPDTEVLMETFAHIFQGEQELQRAMMSHETCTRTQIDNLQDLLINASNECLEKTHRCSEKADCYDSLIGYKCICIDGYTGDGINCQDVDECTSGTNNCSGLAKCTNSIGSFNCSCLPGFEGDGITCSDVNECSAGNYCSANADCVNNAGSFTCTCHTGYSGDGISCSDVDECEMDNKCDANADCINNNGSFRCKCKTGYTGDGFSCTEVPCGSDYHLVEDLGCLIPVRKELSFDRAQENCRKEYNGRLVEGIKTQHHLDLLNKEFKDMFYSPWIGMRMKWDEDGGEDGYPIDPESPLWARNQPTRSHECVHIHLVSYSSASRPELDAVNSCFTSFPSICQL